MLRVKGFTLLEILIALTIVSILAVVAVPMYLNYDVRAKITEGFSLVDPVKLMVSEYYQATGVWPPSNQIAGVQDPGSFESNYVKSIKVEKTLSTGSSAITITYSIPALGSNNTIVLTPANASGNEIQWSCNHGTVADKYRPAACKS